MDVYQSILGGTKLLYDLELRLLQTRR